MNHYERSSSLLKKQGYYVWKTEQPWNRFTKVRRDLFNLMDAVAIDGTGPILGVQVTGGDKIQEHLEKALSIDYLPLWLKSGGRFVIHGWRKLLQENQDGRRGKRSQWEPKIIEITWDGRKIKVK